jgi:hypothetical protein
MGQLPIASAHNPEKLDLVEVKVENIDGRREKAEFLPDTGRISPRFNRKSCHSWACQSLTSGWLRQYPSQLMDRT